MMLSHFVPPYLLTYITTHPTKHPQMFTIYLHTKFKISHCNQQLVIAAKQMSNYNNDTLHAIMNNANKQLILLFCPSETLTSNLDSETSNLIHIVKCFPLSLLHYRMITEQWTVKTCTERKVLAWHLSGGTKRKQTNKPQHNYHYLNKALPVYHCDQKLRWMLLLSAIQRKRRDLQHGKRCIEPQ